MINATTQPGDDQFDIESVDTEYLGDPVPGITSLLFGLVSPKPYPLNIYNLENQKESGLAGTLHPDGTFVPLAPRRVPRSIRAHNHELNRFEDYEVVWDGVVAGGVDLSIDPEVPHKRTFDGSLIGPWPINPPKAERVVNPERARAAALESEQHTRDGGGFL